MRRRVCRVRRRQDTAHQRLRHWLHDACAEGASASEALTALGLGEHHSAQVCSLNNKAFAELVFSAQVVVHRKLMPMECPMLYLHSSASCTLEQAWHTCLMWARE